MAHIQPKKSIVLTKEEKEIDAEYIAMTKESKKEKGHHDEREEKTYERGEEFREKVIKPESRFLLCQSNVLFLGARRNGHCHR